MVGTRSACRCRRERDGGACTRPGSRRLGWRERSTCRVRCAPTGRHGPRTPGVHGHGTDRARSSGRPRDAPLRTARHARSTDREGWRPRGMSLAFYRWSATAAPRRQCGHAYNDASSGLCQGGWSGGAGDPRGAGACGPGGLEPGAGEGCGPEPVRAEDPSRAFPERDVPACAGHRVRGNRWRSRPIPCCRRE